GRTGAAFAAEIGTMKVNEEINALETMGLDPVRFLVVPRLLAAVAVMPLLAIISDLVCLAGGAVVMSAMNVPMTTYVNQIVGFVHPKDFAGGIGKSLVFGLLIAGTGCLRGLQTKTGASAVGQSTTRAVVTSITLIVIADGLFAVLSYQLGL
ncbi:MAG: ABC transporter permease, partial [Lentisphaeria bacterium]